MLRCSSLSASLALNDQIRILKDIVIFLLHIGQKALLKGCLAFMKLMGVQPIAAVPHMRQYGREVILWWVVGIYYSAAAITYLHVLLSRQFNGIWVQAYISGAALSILCLQVLTHLLKGVWRHVPWILC